MNYIILLAVLVFLSGITFSEQEQFYPDYCSPKKTNAIKGVFVFLVILFHTEDYFTFGSNDLWVQDLSRMFAASGCPVSFLFRIWHHGIDSEERFFIYKIYSIESYC